MLLRSVLTEPEMNYSPTSSVIKALINLHLDLMDDEEEVLLSLADVLGGFVEFIGGPGQTVHVLKPLEKLCQVEESTVRDKVTLDFKILKAVESIKKILG